MVVMVLDTGFVKSPKVSHCFLLWCWCLAQLMNILIVDVLVAAWAHVCRLFVQSLSLS